MPAEGNGDLQTLICVLVARPGWCLTLSNPVHWQNWMAAYLGYTLRMRTLFRDWPVMVPDTHTRRRRKLCLFSSDLCWNRVEILKIHFAHPYCIVAMCVFLMSGNLWCSDLFSDWYLQPRQVSLHTVQQRGINLRSSNHWCKQSLSYVFTSAYLLSCRVDSKAAWRWSCWWGPVRWRVCLGHIKSFWILLEVKMVSVERCLKCWCYG